ncbi:MAG: arginyl-tRNA synthetase [Planctomycetota bacterium]|jgi:arginyl-tRNA synthetase
MNGMNIHDELHNLFAPALQALELDPGGLVFEFPSDMEHGDFSTNIAMRYAKPLGKNPLDLAREIVAGVPASAWVSGLEAVAPGFINITLKPEVFSDMLGVIREQRESYGSNDQLAGQKIMVEYTDPNPFKVFHIGHLMTNAHGEALARLYESCGADVVRANYQGDVGPHVAKAIWGMQQLAIEMPADDAPLTERTAYLGRAYAYGATHYKEDASIKETIDTLNKTIYEESDAEIMVLYTKGRVWSLEHFEVLYSWLGTTFDHYFFESEVWRRGMGIVQEYLTKGVFDESGGAIIFPGEKYGLHTRVFISGRGLPLYEAKDIGLNVIKFEKEPDLDKSIIVTANEQSSYFAVVTKALEMINEHVGTRTHHFDHGMMKFPEGKMGSRTGNVITGESLLYGMKELATAKMQGHVPEGVDTEELGISVGVAAIKFIILKQAAKKDIIFDREAALSLEGDTGPYVQYTHARCQSLLTKGAYLMVDVVALPEQWETLEVEKLLMRFPTVIAGSLKDNAPHHITTYLLELSRSFNSWYSNSHIINEEDTSSAYKLAIVKAVSIVVQRGLWMLGIEAPERM